MSSNNKTLINPFKLLGVNYNSSNTELKKAYRYFLNLQSNEFQQWSDRARAFAREKNWTNIGHFILDKMNAENS